MAKTMRNPIGNSKPITIGNPSALLDNVKHFPATTDDDASHLGTETELQQPILLTIPDGCRLIGSCRTRMYEDIKHGHVVAVKLGRRTLLVRSSLEAYAASLPKVRS